MPPDGLVADAQTTSYLRNGEQRIVHSYRQRTIL